MVAASGIGLEWDIVVSGKGGWDLYFNELRYVGGNDAGGGSGKKEW